MLPIFSIVISIVKSLAKDHSIQICDASLIFLDSSNFLQAFSNEVYFPKFSIQVSSTDMFMWDKVEM